MKWAIFKGKASMTMKEVFHTEINNFQDDIFNHSFNEKYMYKENLSFSLFQGTKLTLFTIFSNV